MKKSEIMIGLSYTNGKGRVRKILDRTQDGKYKLYDGQIDTDCVWNPNKVYKEENHDE